MSSRESKALRFSLSFGELAKLEKSFPLVGPGYKFKRLIALESKRPTGIIFRSPQADMLNVGVPGPQIVLKGSRTNPVVVATRPETGSTAPAVTARVVDRKSTRLNSSHTVISYAVFC